MPLRICALPLQVNAMHSQPCRYLSKLRLALPPLHCTAPCTTLPPHDSAFLCHCVTMTIHLATTPLPVPTALCISAPLTNSNTRCAAIAYPIYATPCPCLACHYSTDTQHRSSHRCNALTELLSAILCRCFTSAYISLPCRY